MTDPKYPIEFEIGGVQFRGRYLDPEKALDVFAVLSPVLSTVLDSIDAQKLAEAEETGNATGLIAGAIHAAVGTLKDLPKIAPYFHGSYQVQVGDAGTWFPLVGSAGMKEQIFAGKSSLYIAWVIAAIRSEFADFLGSNASSILKDLGRVCGLQIQRKPTGPSGA